MSCRDLGFAVLLAFASAAAGPDRAEELKLSREEQEVIDLTNAERKKADLPPLAPDAKLTAAARGHAANMAKQEKVDHVLDEKGLKDRVADAGYKARATGENVAWNAGGPRQALEVWMASEPHKANILRAEYTDIGVAVAKSEKGEPYWVQVFGTPQKE